MTQQKAKQKERLGKFAYDALGTSLLDWYDVHARDLAWRIGPYDRAKGLRPDPYHVWLSEIMLQQTTIAHATRYFLKFLELWPNVEALAAAPLEEVMANWAGLGYYARARNLHACANEIVRLGGFPNTPKALQALPGIGAYTAGAIAAIAFDYPSSAVDANAERVLARMLAEDGNWTELKKKIRILAEALVPAGRAADYVQALMDLGAMICTPKTPNCSLCPWRKDCRAHLAGQGAAYPKKPKKAKRPHRYGVAYAILCNDEIWFEQRPNNGLLGGMLGLPCSDWISKPLKAFQIEENAPLGGDWQAQGEVTHVFTHFSLELCVYSIRLKYKPDTGKLKSLGGKWIAYAQIDRAGLPSLMLKAARLLKKPS